MSIAEQELIDPADEYPHEPPEGIPLWTENYCFQAWDPAREVGFFFSLGTHPMDARLWREVAIAFLPGGELLIGKGYGRNGTATGPGGAGLRFDCEEPMRRWVVSYDGALQRTSTDEILAGRLRDAARSPGAMRLEFLGMAPLWDVGRPMREQVWGHSHHEQACRVRGSLTFEGRTIEVDGTGFRDHTQGPRDSRGIRRHSWMHAEFPSGRSFGALYFEGAATLSRAFVAGPDALHDGRVLTPALLTDLSRATEPFSLSLETDLGVSEIQGEAIHNVVFTVAPPNDVLIGLDRDADTLICWEAQVRYTWDGEVGYGLLERTALLREVSQPAS